MVGCDILMRIYIFHFWYANSFVSQDFLMVGVNLRRVLRTLLHIFEISINLDNIIKLIRFKLKCLSLQNK